MRSWSTRTHVKQRHAKLEPITKMQKTDIIRGWMNVTGQGRGGGHFHGKVIGMLVVFFRVQNSDSGIFLRVFWKILCRNELKMRSFQNVFSKIGIF